MECDNRYKPCMLLLFVNHTTLSALHFHGCDGGSHCSTHMTHDVYGGEVERTSHDLTIDGNYLFSQAELGSKHAE